MQSILQRAYTEIQIIIKVNHSFLFSFGFSILIICLKFRLLLLFVIQDLERQNETLQEGLRKYHQEQKALLDKVNMLQQQLTQVNPG